MITIAIVGLIVAGIAVVLGPTSATLINNRIQDRKEKRREKMIVFTELMSYQPTFQIRQEWVDTLNKIEVIFHDHPSVIKLWHKYFSSLTLLSIPNAPPPLHEESKRLRLDLIIEIARVLGYKNIKTTDVDRMYVPGGLVERAFLEQRRLQTAVKMGEEISKNIDEQNKNSDQNRNTNVH